MLFVLLIVKVVADYFRLKQISHKGQTTVPRTLNEKLFSKAQTPTDTMHFPSEAVEVRPRTVIPHPDQTDQSASLKCFFTALIAFSNLAS